MCRNELKTIITAYRTAARKKNNVILRKGVTAANAVKEQKEVKQLTLW